MFWLVVLTFQPSWKILVSWDDYSQYYMEKNKPPTSDHIIVKIGGPEYLGK